jgi:hypothetical protein
LIYQATNDEINLRTISERIGTFPKMTILSVQIQGYIARLYSMERNADGINVHKQQIKDFIDQQKKK